MLGSGAPGAPPHDRARRAGRRSGGDEPADARPRRARRGSGAPRSRCSARSTRPWSCPTATDGAVFLGDRAVRGWALSCCCSPPSSRSPARRSTCSRAAGAGGLPLSAAVARAPQRGSASGSSSCVVLGLAAVAGALPDEPSPASAARSAAARPLAARRARPRRRRRRARLAPRHAPGSSRARRARPEEDLAAYAVAFVALLVVAAARRSSRRTASSSSSRRSTPGCGSRSSARAPGLAHGCRLRDRARRARARARRRSRSSSTSGFARRSTPRRS